MNNVIEFGDRAMVLQNYQLGKMICRVCNNYTQDVSIPLNKKTMDKFEDHKLACESLRRLNDMDESLKTPAIWDQIKKFQEVITSGYN